MAHEARIGVTHTVLENDRASEWMGIEVIRAERGEAEIRMSVRREMTNGFDIAHGGMIFAFADTCFAMACNDPDSDGAIYTVARGADIEFLKSVKVGEELVARGVVRHEGRSGLYDITVTRGEEVVAEFRGRSRTLEARS